jgi:mannan endo-1,4-beta-mannosidase
LFSDAQATKETRKRFQQLRTLSSQGVMIGYQDALAYGVGWTEDDNMCDMYRTSGEYPAVFGWDFGDIHKSTNLDTVSFSKMVNWIKRVHLMGGINTISWHMDNPVTGASSWDKADIAGLILPGGEHHDKFIERLDKAARLIKNCRNGNKPIPIIFRPFHEHNGDWFWWGKGNTSEEDYVALYRFVFNYFTQVHGIHQLIYAFSPDRSRLKDTFSREEYLYAYPGDEYVDLLGLDNYQDVKVSENDSTKEQSIQKFILSLEILTDIAAEKGKVAALTETGLEGIKEKMWFTNRILEPLLSSEKAQRISYIHLWRNANTVHHYMIYPEHPNKDDFIEFVNEPIILTLKDISHKKIRPNSFSAH